MQGLEEQFNSRPMAEPFQPDAYEPQKPANIGAKAAGMPVAQPQASVGQVQNEQAKQVGGMDGLSQQLGQAKAVGTYSKYGGIDPLKQGASQQSLDTSNSAYQAAGGESTKPQKVEWQGPIHTGPTGFVNYSDFRGANAGDIGASAERYRAQLGNLQKQARDAALRYEKSQSPEDRKAWQDATDAADTFEQTNQGGSRLDRSLGSFTGGYDKANASWDAEKKDLGTDVTNEEQRSAQAKSDAERAAKQKLADDAAAGDAAAQAQIARQNKADRLAAAQNEWRTLSAKSKEDAGREAMGEYLRTHGGPTGGGFMMSNDSLYASMDAGSMAAAAHEEKKKQLEDEINRLKQELS